MAEHNFNSLQARLQRETDPNDQGQMMPLTVAALFETDPIQRLEKLVKALESERLLAPALVENTTECASAATLLETKYGRVSVAFTDMEALQRWNPQARPVPLPARQQALIAMVQSGGRLLINPVSDVKGEWDLESGFRLPRPAVQALAHGDSWLPAWRDNDLQKQLQEVATALNPALQPLITVLADTDPVLKILVEFSVPAGVSGFEIKGELERMHQELSKVERLQTAGELIEFVPLLLGGAR